MAGREGRREKEWVMGEYLDWDWDTHPKRAFDFGQVWVSKIMILGKIWYLG